MDNPNPVVERPAEVRMPRWVSLAFPLGVGPRRSRIRDWWVYATGGIMMGILVGLPAFLFDGGLHPYRWWVIGYFAIVALFQFWEWQAIRWMDRFERWPA